MKVSIVLDTNYLFVSKISNFREVKCLFNLQRLINIIKENNLNDIVKVIIPEIVKKEILQQQSQQYYESIKRFASMEFPDTHIKIDNNYDNFLEKKFMEEIDKLNRNVRVEIIDYPPIERFHNIIDKAVMKKAPFEGIKKQSDKGFKDTIVWESLIAYKGKNKDENIILITNDKVFLNKELDNDYKKLFHENIVIIESKDKEETISNLLKEINNLTSLTTCKTKEEKIYEEFKNTIIDSNFNMLYKGLSYESFRTGCTYIFKDLNIIKFNFLGMRELVENGIKINYFVVEIKLTLNFTDEYYNSLDCEECFTDYWEYEIYYYEQEDSFAVIGCDGFSDNERWKKNEPLVLKKN